MDASAGRSEVYTYIMAKRTQSEGSESLEVGIRALREDLSRWLRVARDREVVVTERGRPVARLVPIGARPGLERLIAQGSVVLPERAASRVDRPSLATAHGSVSDLVTDQRR
jgi:prevent-host-death family protein